MPSESDNLAGQRPQTVEDLQERRERMEAASLRASIPGAWQLEKLTCASLTIRCSERYNEALARKHISFRSFRWIFSRELVFFEQTESSP